MKMNEIQKIDVALAADDNYFSGLLVCAWSIARHCSIPARLVIHVIDGGISESNWQLLSSLIASCGVSLDRILINQADCLASYPEYNGSSKMTFVRLFLDRLLPGVKWAIYSDVDVIWLADVCQVLGECQEGASMAVVAEDSGFVRLSDSEHQWFVKNGLEVSPGRYFCAGVMVFNLARMRNEGLFASALRFLADNDYRLPQNDQTALNAVALSRTDIQYLDRCWQTGTGNLPEVITSPDIVIHYAQDAPWKTIQTNHHLLTEAILFWHRINARLRGISTWRSLRTCNSALGIVIGRLLYLLTSRFSIARGFIRLVMHIKGNSAGIPCINAFMRKLIISYQP